MTPTSVKITPPRLTWLQQLEKNGETPWSKMPSGATTSWNPMVEAGLIETRFCYETVTRYFKITDAGRQVLAQHTNP